MSYTSVILRCPDALYVWFEERLTGGTVEQAMLTVLYDWQRMNQTGREHEGAHMAWLNARLLELTPIPRAFPAPLPNGERVHDEKRPDERPILAQRWQRRKQRHKRSAKEPRRTYAR